MVPTEEELPESLPGFDLADGLKRLHGNKRLYRKLLLNFANDYSDIANKIRRALDEKDLERARSLVHDLKGIAGNLSAVDLLAAVTDLWRLLRAQDPDKGIAREALDQKMQDLRNNLRRALKALQVLAPSPEQISGAVPSEKTIVLPVELTKAELDSIRDAVEMGDVAELISIAKK